eukprot:CAMPEP_0119125168 /NCGR_PEP_ID=MMETSP1310-20130426/4533_1 /TAXON_ID=464262 /ORGANISM="Genus nov. species nov., Strain RCC2339" /LENGTH=306 /DNA_ID=CAMNT_0007115213 /DNA_START=59 /DNA_END=979 /DNA_ORIENTATION=-
MGEWVFEVADDAESHTLTWMWWTQMVTVVVCNLCFTLYVVLNVTWAKDAKVLQYQRRMIGFAQPFIFECGYRSLFPSLYIPRQVLFDTFRNSIIVDRTLAAIGEVCWVVQIHYAFRYFSDQVVEYTGPTRLSRVIGVFTRAAVVFAVAGEFFSYYSLCTLNNLYATLEPCCWTILFGLITFCAFAIMYQLRALGNTVRGNTRQVWTTCLICAVSGVVYLYYMVTANIPMYYGRWVYDQEHGVEYLPCGEGMKQAVVERNVTRDFNDWIHDFSWMTLYFSLACWSSICLMNAPRILRASNLLPAGKH